MTPTFKQYIQGNGHRCLSHGGEDIDYNTVDFEDGVVWQRARCKACEVTWNDIYELANVRIVSAGRIGAKAAQLSGGTPHEA